MVFVVVTVFLGRRVLVNTVIALGVTVATLVTNQVSPFTKTANTSNERRRGCQSRDKRGRKCRSIRLRRRERNGRGGENSVGVNCGGGPKTVLLRHTGVEGRESLVEHLL